jgi:transposase
VLLKREIMKNKKTYPIEFKIQAVKLAVELGSVAEAGRQLGVDAANIHYWKENPPEKSKIYPVKKPEIKNAELADENQKLRQEVAQLKKVNHILKSAAAFFSQDHLK